MKKLLLLAVVFSSVSVFAGNGQCRMCEINRDNNKKNPAPPMYYEDYLKSESKGGAAPAAAPAAAEAPAAAPAK